MSALPPFHQFRHGRPLQDGAQDALDDTARWDDHAAQDEQETWRYTRRRQRDSSGTEVYPHVYRMVLIGVLSLVCWAMVLAVWHVVANALR